MRSVYPNLIAELHKREMDYSDLAEKIGMSKMAVYRRLRGITEWQLPEVIKVCQFLEIYDAITLFLRLNNES